MAQSARQHEINGDIFESNITWNGGGIWHHGEMHSCIKKYFLLLKSFVRFGLFSKFIFDFKTLKKLGGGLLEVNEV